MVAPTFTWNLAPQKIPRPLTKLTDFSRLSYILWLFQIFLVANNPEEISKLFFSCWCKSQFSPFFKIRGSLYEFIYCFIPCISFCSFPVRDEKMISIQRRKFRAVERFYAKLWLLSDVKIWWNQQLRTVKFGFLNIILVSIILKFASHLTYHTPSYSWC